MNKLEKKVMEQILINQMTLLAASQVGDRLSCEEAEKLRSSVSSEFCNSRCVLEEFQKANEKDK